MTWPQPTISLQIDLQRTSIETIRRSVYSAVTGSDRPNLWAASIVAIDALKRAELNLSVAAMSLGIEEDLESIRTESPEGRKS